MHRLTQLLNKDYAAQIATGKFAFMNRQVFTVAIFPTEGLQALKSELFDVVFVEHDGFLRVWFKSPLTPLYERGGMVLSVVLV